MTSRMPKALCFPLASLLVMFSQKPAMMLAIIGFYGLKEMLLALYLHKEVS